MALEAPAPGLRTTRPDEERQMVQLRITLGPEEPIGMGPGGELYLKGPDVKPYLKKLDPAVAEAVVAAEGGVLGVAAGGGEREPLLALGAERQASLPDIEDEDADDVEVELEVEVDDDEEDEV